MTNPMRRQIRFNAFQMNTPSHQSPGLWTHPRDTSHRYTSAGHWVELAQLLERGGFDALFLADVLGVYDVYEGSADAALRHAVQAPLNDPLALVPLLAHATRHLGFGVTAALTYEHPYTFARRMSTLDHLSGGRVGWNIVTGYLDSAARNLGLERQLGHDARYDLADEYLEVVYKLWEKSWEDGRRPCRQDQRRVCRPGPRAPDPPPWPALHGARHPPVRTLAAAHALPVPGRHLAARPGLRRAPCRGDLRLRPSKKVVKRYVDQTREAVRAAGRDPREVLVYAQALIVTAPTAGLARAKYGDYLDHVDIEAALALLSGWTGVDFSTLPLDATVDYIDTDAGRTALASLSSADPERKWTVREAARFIGLGGRGPVLVGDPGQIADQLDAWMLETGADGFNLAFAVAHESMRDVVELVVPELQRRGRYRKDYGAAPCAGSCWARRPPAGRPPGTPGVDRSAAALGGMNSITQKGLM
jgi:alkanesulfonate monooxygenase SsuD/methylene tetrahydromethanopterin reductase-like flavin-dependent oxidoreductase (luciferase family)